MTITYIRFVSVTFVSIVLIFTIAASAHAEENVSLEADATVDVGANATTDTPKPRPFAPLRILDKREDVKDKMEDNRDRMEDKRDVMIQGGVKDRMEDNRDLMEDKRDTMEDRRENLREKGLMNAVDRIKFHLRRFYSVLEATINRMDKLEDRVQARADKMELEGADVSVAEAFLLTANTELDLAADDLASIKAEVEASSSLSASTTPAEVFRPVHELLKSAREHVRNAWEAIKDAVQSLKADASVETETEVEVP